MSSGSSSSHDNKRKKKKEVKFPEDPVVRGSDPPLPFDAILNIETWTKFGSLMYDSFTKLYCDSPLMNIIAKLYTLPKIKF